MRIARKFPVPLVCVALALSACGTDDSETAENGPESGDGAADVACGPPEADPDRVDVGDGSFPATVTDGTGEVTVEEAPERIISLSAAHTEMLFAIGAGEQVEAVDEQSNYPEEAPTTDLSGFEPSVEAITEYDPDLVLLDRSAEDTAEQLESVDVPTLVLDAAEDLEGTYAQLRVIGDATGNPEEADAEADRVETEFNEAVESVCAEVGETGLSFYQELDDTLHSATSETFAGQVYASFGLVNIADEADDGTTGGYPQLSPEFVVDEDADLIFLTHGDEEAVADRPAFDAVTAVANDAVYALDPDIASRWGPRVVDFAELVGDAVLENAEQ